MKKRMFRLSMALALIAIFAIGTASVGVSQALAGTERVDFDVYNVVCEVLDVGKLWVSDDGIVQLRNQLLRSVVISDNAFNDGAGVISASFNQDPSTGFMSYFGELEIHPTDYPDNYWAGSYSVQVVPSGADGIARLKGYGNHLSGWLEKAHLTPLSPEQLASFSYACDGNMPVAGVRAETTILMPGGE